ncbi:MAG: hypothetical protein NWR72_03650 [Bacteroidia bacterium]|nr:hypothetical protein [Bacteroidia bacterium]
MEFHEVEEQGSSDSIFLKVASASLLGIGAVLLLLGFSCKVWGWGYCSMEILPILGSDPRFLPDITMINLPLAMLVIGLGIRLFSPYGWWVVTILLMVLLVLFAFLSIFHWERWPWEEMSDGSWVKVSLLAMPYADSLFTCLLISLILMVAILYWWDPHVRMLYWRKSAPIASTIESDVPVS